MSRPQPHRRDDYAQFQVIPTRWADNDVYGHVNNVVYYAFFDTAVNRYLMEQGVLRPDSPVIGLVVETSCSYFSPVSFPDTLDVGLRVASIGKSSVRYELAIFRAGDPSASAQGYFVHVYVDAANRRPVDLPEPFKQALQGLQIDRHAS